MSDNPNETPVPRSRGASLVTQISDSLRHDIETGVFLPGDRLPSEAQLTRIHSVSRAVVREAIAVLRSDGLVVARKGSGVFALERKPVEAAPFDDLDLDRISSVIELLELRTACEVQSAGFAAARRSASQIEAIMRAHEHVGTCLEAGTSTRDADFALHLAIAEATQNRRFPEFLMLVRGGIIPRAELQGGTPGDRPADYNQHLQAEHSRIVDAVIEGNTEEARNAMADHLHGSLTRYKVLLRRV